MRHRVVGRKLGRTSGHRWAMYRNQITSLLTHEKMVTTEAKAKELQGLVEKVISLGREGSLASRRRALTHVYSKKVVEKLFEDIARRYADRPGGYTRVVKLGRRNGDNASMAQIELVQE
ncbi:MAG: 50S ribosomal protein L17 [Chloroflexota bacterium]